MKQSTAIFVLGMHRSGTSAMTRVLNLLGLELGERLFGAADDNVKGFWEDIDIVQLNTELLAQLGLCWNSLGYLPDGWQNAEHLQPFKARIHELLAAKFSDAELWGIKDPRLCRLLPIYKQALATDSTQTKAVLCLREPIEVARSLQQRDGTSIDFGLALWLLHVMDAERHSREMPRTIVEYDALLEGWGRVVDKIQRELDIRWPIPPKAASDAVEAFLDPSLRHQQSSQKIHAREPQLERLAYEVYALLRHESDGPGLWQAMDALALEHAKELRVPAALALALCVENQMIMAGPMRQLKKLQETLTTTESALHEARNRLTRAQGELASTQGQLMSTQAELMRAQNELQASKETIARMEQSLSWRLTAPLRWSRYILDGRAFRDYVLTPFKCRVMSWKNKASEGTNGHVLAEWGVEPDMVNTEGALPEVKPIAIYFPQLHPIPENDRWWGKGFTDWVNVKKAKPQFEGHYQPRIPLGGNYYDQSKLEVIRKQVDLARQYGIYGFCHYHYWFDGKQLLETPTNLMLENKDIDFPFCLSWANETWSRRWDGRDREILIRQTHPVDKARWKLHFDYLIQFWTDDRAIRVDGKPVFCIYNPDRIPEVENMLDYWRELAVQHGLDGLYFIHQKAYDYEDASCLRGFDAEFLFEPNEAANSVWYQRQAHGLFTHLGRFVYYRMLPAHLQEVLRDFKLRHFKKLDIRDYDKVWEIAISKRPSHLPVTFPGAFPDWDNTPRYKERAIIYKGASPERFEYWLRRLVATMPARGLPENFIFINAWNEWAEGAYLEPDERYGYAYLEAIKNVVGK